MHKITMYENLKQTLEEELSKIEKKPDMNADILQYIYYLTRSISSICKIIGCEMDKQYHEEEQYDRGYSGRRGMNSYRDQSYGNYPMPVEGRFDWSYENRMSRTHMPSYGHYDEYANRMRSYDGEMHTNKEKMAMMLANASSPQEKAAIQECMDKMK